MGDIAAAGAAAGAIGGIVAIIGIVLLRGAGDSGDQTTAGEVPAGDGWLFEFEFSFLGDGHVSGTWQVRCCGQLSLYVMSKPQRDAFLEGSQAGSLFSSTGDRGNFDVRMPGGTYFAVFTHAGPQDAGSTQTFDVTMRVRGYDPGQTFIGVALLGLGLMGVAVFLLRQRKEEKEQAEANPSPQGIVYFEPPPSTHPATGNLPASRPRVVEPPEQRGPQPPP